MTDTYISALTDEQLAEMQCSINDPFDLARAIERAAIEAYQRQQHAQPETPQQIVDALRYLSHRMLAVGSTMDYYGGWDENMRHHGGEMVGASQIVWGWADVIDGKTKGQNEQIR